MKALLPKRKVYGPNGETSEIELATDHITMGRFAEFNDVGLKPAPQQLVTRKAHCVLEREADTWRVINNGNVPVMSRIISSRKSIICCMGYHLKTRSLM